MGVYWYKSSEVSPEGCRVDSGHMLCCPGSNLRTDDHPARTQCERNHRRSMRVLPSMNSMAMKNEDDAPCPSCEGTGLVAMKPRPERRRFPRYRTDLPITVRNRLESDLEGHCNVIAEGGLSITLLEAIAAGSVVLLQFVVPTHPTPLRVWAVVRHLIGLQHGLGFISITEGERLSIRQFCNELALQSMSGTQTDSR